MPQLDLFTLIFQFKSFFLFFFLIYFFFIVIIFPLLYKKLWVRRTVLKSSWSFYSFFKKRHLNFLFTQYSFFFLLSEQTDKLFDLFFIKFFSQVFNSIDLLNSFVFYLSK